MMDEQTLKESLKDRLLVWLAKYEEIDLGDAHRTLTMILNNYKVEPKEESLMIYTEGKNERFLKRFVLAKAIAGCSEKTIKNYTKVVETFLIETGKDADTITAEDVQCYFAKKLMQGISKSYVDTIRRYLSSFYVYLSREELVVSNPMLKVEKIKFHIEKEAAFSDYEIEKMREACKNSREKAIVELLLSTGCRASEVTSIKIEDMENETIVVLGKGGKYRKVYLNAKSVVAIQTYLQDRQDVNPYLFPAAKHTNENETLFKRFRTVKDKWYVHPELVSETKQMSKETINNCVKRIGKRAGVTGVHTHRFRRTCATLALRRGMTIELVSKMLGHEQIQTTQIYLDLREEDLKNAHEKYVY